MANKKKGNNKKLKNTKKIENLPKVKTLNNTRVSRNHKLYTNDLTVTKQQQFEFAELKEEELDTSFIEKKPKRKKNTQEKKEPISLEQPESNKTILLKRSILFLIMVIFLLISFTIYHFTTFNHKKIEIVTKTVEKKVIDDNYVFVGDSITWMYDLDKYFPEQPVINSGVNGDFTYGILGDMKNRIYQYNPSKVFLLIGTNDIYKDKTVEEISENVEEIVKKIKENRPYCQIYIESIYPINDSDDEKIDKESVNIRTNDYIKKINKEYKRIAKEQKATYINLYDKLIDEEGNLKLEYTKEGLHLTDKGYEVVTEELNKYIRD